MLDILLRLRERAPIDFEIIGVNLDQKQPGFPEHVLPEYLTELGVPFHIENQDTYSIVKRLVPEGKTTARCARACAAGFSTAWPANSAPTKIALGHHRDDILQTLFLNLFYGGQAQGHAAQAAVGRRQEHRDPPARLRERARSRTLRRAARVPDHPVHVVRQPAEPQARGDEGDDPRLGEAFPRADREYVQCAVQCRALALDGPQAVRLRRACARTDSRMRAATSRSTTIRAVPTPSGPASRRSPSFSSTTNRRPVPVAVRSRKPLSGKGFKAGCMLESAFLSYRSDAVNIVVLAAGAGKRMRSALPKVLHPLAGRPLLSHVLDTARGLSPTRLVVVVGHGAELVRKAVAAPDVAFAEQTEQLGTGHAVQQALPLLDPSVPTPRALRRRAADPRLEPATPRRRRCGRTLRRIDRDRRRPQRLRPHGARRRRPRDPHRRTQGRHRGRARDRRNQHRHRDRPRPYA